MSLAQRSVGNGPNLTLVHGWGLGSRAWDRVAAQLAEHFTVNIVDLPGYGDSSPQPGASLDDLADALAHALPPRAMVCGWSLGAMVALACARRHPRRVARLVLVGATASFLVRDGWDAGVTPERLGDFFDELARDPAELLRHFSMLINVGDARPRETVRSFAPCLKGDLPATTATLCAGLEMLGESDLRPWLAEVTQPALIIQGEADPLMPPPVGQRTADLLPGARLKTFAGCAHAPFASDPEAFVAAVCGFAGVEA